MTLKQAIDRLDALLPNPYTDSEKIRWLSALDGLVYDRILSTHEDAPASFNGYTDSTAQTTVLLVPEPYDEIYIFFLQSRVLYFSGEIRRYNSAAELFNKTFYAFRDRYNALHAPLTHPRKLG